MKKILIIDIETTGFINKGGKIVEVGIVELNLQNGDRKILFDKVCHERPITLQHVEHSWIVKNGFMTVDEIKHSKQFNFYKKQIQEIINAYPLGATAFNNKFDFDFLQDRHIKFPRKLSCIMEMSKDVCKIPPTERMLQYGYNTFKKPNAQEAYNHFFGDKHGYIEAHRGADDAMHEAEIAYQLYKDGILKL